ncbi:helix-turn-helix domain-containing protein [Streptomyces sp. TX20-6-3]|uniref:helix-turn-helix domain-containing protein n=1 Tax=Streptomyces sp. TX20-6-3 TaxID=3028705 RepID=UPI003018271B
MDFEIRKEGRPHGPTKLVKERELCLALVDQGMSGSEVSRIVGVNSRTGRKWSYGRPEGRAKGPRLRAHDVPAVAVRSVSAKSWPGRTVPRAHQDPADRAPTS